MRELIRNIIREQVSEKYLSKLLNYIKESGLTIKSVGGGITLARRDIETGQIEWVNKKNTAEAVIDREDPYLRTYLAGYTDEDIISILSEVAGKNLEEISNILDLQSDSSGSVFLIYEDPKLFLATENMKSIPSKLGGNIVLIRDKVWFDGRPSFSGINNLSRLKNVFCDLWVGAELDYLGGLEFVKGDCSLSVCNNLDTLIEVKGKFKLQSGKTNSLGKLRKVWGKCVLGDGLTELNSLGDLEYVGDELVITSPNIKSLGDLKYVGGKLRLRKSSVEDLGNLEFVGGSILIDRSASPNLIQQIKERNFKMTKG